MIMILGYCYGCGSTFLYKFYVNWSVIFIETIQIEKGLLNLDAFCEYMGIKKTKARELLHNPTNGFTVRIGNRLYAHKGKLDEWLLEQIQ